MSEPYWRKYFPDLQSLLAHKADMRRRMETDTWGRAGIPPPERLHPVRAIEDAAEMERREREASPAAQSSAEASFQKAVDSFLELAAAVRVEELLRRAHEAAAILQEEEACERKGLVRYKAVAIPAWSEWIPVLAEEMAKGVGIPVPEVRVVRPCRFGEKADVIHRAVPEDRRLFGFAHPSEEAIYLVDGMSRRDTLDTLGHEMMHVYQYENGLPASEKAASEAGEKIAALYDDDTRRFELETMREAA